MSVSRLEIEAARAEAADAGLWAMRESDRFDLRELTEPPPPQPHVLFPYLPAGCPAVLTGAGGTSKTGLAVNLAIAIAAGLDAFGQRIEPARVLIVSAEDRRDTIRRHVYANAQDLTDRERQALASRLFVKDTVGRGFKLTRTVAGFTDTAAEVGQLIEYAHEAGPFALVVFDTVSRLNGGDESNEGFARFVESMERVSVETGAATLALHHAGKAQTRADVVDQYAGRGGSALSDNVRSVLHLASVPPDAKDCPGNAAELIAEGRLLRLAHVKANGAPLAEVRYFERVRTPHAAMLREFAAEFADSGNAGTWARIERWMREQSEVKFPTRATLESLGREFGSRSDIRRALQWAEDRGQLLEHPHPSPKGGRKVYLALPRETTANDYRRAKEGEA